MNQEQTQSLNFYNAPPSRPKANPESIFRVSSGAKVCLVGTETDTIQAHHDKK